MIPPLPPGYATLPPPMGLMAISKSVAKNQVFKPMHLYTYQYHNIMYIVYSLILYLFILHLYRKACPIVSNQFQVNVLFMPLSFSLFPATANAKNIRLVWMDQRTGHSANRKYQSVQPAHILPRDCHILVSFFIGKQIITIFAV